jgi:excisionase family DNA binding protein
MAMRLATVKEACAYAKLGRSKLYEKMRAGEIAAFRRDGQTLIDLDSIDVMNERTCEPWLPAPAVGGIKGV